MELVNYEATLEALAGDSQLLRTLVTIFREDAPGLVEELDQYVRQANSTMVRETLHKLRGLVAHFYCESIVKLLGELEYAAKLGDIQPTVSNIEIVRDQLLAISKELEGA